MQIRLQPKQDDLLNLLEASGPTIPTVIGTGGSRGSAKSGALRRIAIVLACKYPKIVVFIVRRTLGDLLENHQEKIALEFPEIDAQYRAGDYEYALTNGSRIVFVYAEGPIDVKRVSYGPECTFLFIDQAEQFTEDELLSFRICNRWPSMPAGFPKTCLFFNVGVGLAAGYLRRIFHLKQFKPNERPQDYTFIQTYGWDNFEWFRGEVAISEDDFYDLSSQDRFNIFITETTEGRKMNALPKHRREGELLGNFDAFTGQYFADVWGDHCILTPEQVNSIVQPWWTCWMAQDWGFGDHDCHIWLVTGKLSPEKWMEYFGGSCEWPMDIAIIYRELLVVGRAESDLAEDIVRMTPIGERPMIKDFFLSQDAFGQKSKQEGSENTVGQTFTKILSRHGLPAPAAASQDRVNGWRFLYNCLRQSGLRGCNVDSERAKQGPALFISANCTECIENLPLASRDEDDPNDVKRVAGEVWEDVTDAIRYGLYSKLAPKKKAPVAIRAAEASASAKTPTERHLSMLHFKEQESRQRSVGRRRWR